MTENRTNLPGADTLSSRPRGAVFRWVISGAIVLCCVGLLWNWFRPAPRRPESIGPADSPSQTQPGDTAAAAPAAIGEHGIRSSSNDANGRSGGTAGAGQAAAPVAIDPAVAALVAGLTQLTGTNVDLTPEAVGAWRTNLTNVVQTGSAAVPALKAFLNQKSTYDFTPEAWQTLGYRSPRLAAIDALRQIGGTEALEAMQDLLSTTQSPMEIAVLAHDLDEASPGQYRQQALAAARVGLTSAVSGNDPELDVAPLFEVFQKFGDASVVPDLEAAIKDWNYYAIMALADLPDNAGMPSLLRLADPSSTSSSRILALQMVAELAGSNPEARQFLASQVAEKTIPQSVWGYLAGPLAGDKYYPVDSAITQYPQVQSSTDLRSTYMAIGNQSFYTLPGNQSLTPEGIQARLALVDQLLRSTSDPTAQTALQQARDTLTQRSARLASQTPSASGP